MSKIILQDYFDLSIKDKLNQYETKLDNLNIDIKKNFKETRSTVETLQKENDKIYEHIDKVNTNLTNKLSCFENVIMDKLDKMESFLNNLDKKINEIALLTEEMNNKFENMKSTLNYIKENSNNNSGILEYHRLLNTAIRRQVPVSFCTSKAIDDLNKLSLNKK